MHSHDATYWFRDVHRGCGWARPADRFFWPESHGNQHREKEGDTVRSKIHLHVIILAISRSALHDPAPCEWAGTEWHGGALSFQQESAALQLLETFHFGSLQMDDIRVMKYSEFEKSLHTEAPRACDP